MREALDHHRHLTGSTIVAHTRVPSASITDRGTGSTLSGSRVKRTLLLRGNSTKLHLQFTHVTASQVGAAT